MLRTIFAMIVSAALAGCAQHKGLAVAPPATPQQIASLRAAYAKVDPGARVGRVAAVMPSDHLLAVGNVPLRDFHLNDVFTIMDSNQHVITEGHVIAITSDYLHLKYAPPAPNSRDPVIGDIAVHVSPVRMYHPAP